MKLLGWMHQKIRQRSVETFEEFTLGNSCTSLSGQRSLDDKTIRKPLNQNYNELYQSISELDYKKVEDLEVLPDFFYGFLAIGTLGLKPVLSEPVTPKFGGPNENIFETETEVTEKDLKIINDELDKFIEAEAKEEACDESSRKTTYGSIVTPGSKQMAGEDTEEYVQIEICPLQGYLFGSSIDIPEPKIEKKKENASLAELFQMTTVDEEYSKLNYEEKKHTKGTYKSTVSLMKKMLKKIHTSSGSSTKSAKSDSFHSASTKSKMHKVLKMFQRKIHPESVTATEEFKESHIHDVNNTFCQTRYENKDFLLDKDSVRFSEGPFSKGDRCRNFIPGLPRNEVLSSYFGRNREQWIKTDAEYLVLEL